MRNRFLFIFLFCFSVIAVAQTQKPKQKKFKDTLDNAIDLGHYLTNLNGVLPVVMPITEPAVGFGAAGAGLYFLPKETKKGERKQSDVIGVGGGYTANNTWFLGGGYFGFWKNDHLRYRGVFGYGDINLEYYGTTAFPELNGPYEYNVQSFMFLQQAVLRIKNSNFFIGGKYQLAKTRVSFFENVDLGDLDVGNLELLNSGIAIIGEYENFDNIFTPNQGSRIHLSFDQNLKFLGSDTDFSKLLAYGNFYFKTNTFWTPGLRIESQWASDSTPFYTLPYVKFRGVPAFRYTGNFVLLSEMEHRFAISRRWDGIAFAGIADASDSIENISIKDPVWNAGVGFRYLIARILGLKMGLDVAKGPEDWGVYVVIGSSWLR